MGQAHRDQGPSASYSHDALLEVAFEEVRLVALHLPVLHGAPTQVVVQLGGVDGSAALLVPRGALPDPAMDVVGQDAARAPGLQQGQTSRSDPASAPLIPYRDCRGLGAPESQPANAAPLHCMEEGGNFFLTPCPSTTGDQFVGACPEAKTEKPSLLYPHSCR